MIEKDVWELKNLDIKIRSNPIYNVKTLDFRKIYQPDISVSCKLGKSLKYIISFSIFFLFL